METNYISVGFVLGMLFILLTLLIASRKNVSKYSFSYKYSNSTSHGDGNGIIGIEDGLDLVTEIKTNIFSEYFKKNNICTMEDLNIDSIIKL